MIYLLRHGEIGTDLEKRFIGWTDWPLNETGLRQAQSWQKAWATIEFEQIYCSDLERTRQTAHIIAGNRAAEVLEIPELREIKLGELERLTMREVQKRLPRTWKQRGKDLFSFRPDGGESFADLRERVLPAFEKIARSASGNVLIVAHAGVNRTILCHLLGMPPENLFRIGQDYAGLNRIDINRTPWCLVSLNHPPERV